MGELDGLLGGAVMWVGKEVNKDEKAKGMQVAKAFCIKGVEELEEGVNDGPDAATNFWNHIKSVFVLS
jgi:hypothetical protein